MHAIIRAGVLAAAVLWATDSIALEPKRPDSLPALDLSCYIAQSVAFTTLDNTGSDYIFAWSDNEAMGLRIFVVNQRDRLVSLLEVPPSSQTLPFGTLRVLKCNDTANTASSASWLERRKGGNPILDVWRTSTATFPKHLPVRAQGSVSSHSSSQEMAFKRSPLNHQAGR